MRIERIRLVREKTHLDIQGITLLSIEEYKKHKQHIKPASCVWWLRSPGARSECAACVVIDGSVNGRGEYVNSRYAVRPALQVGNLESANLKVGDSFCVFGYEWTVISKGLALCDEALEEHAFCEDWRTRGANGYEKSDVKRFLEEWFDEQRKAEEAR